MRSRVARRGCRPGFDRLEGKTLPSGGPHILAAEPLFPATPVVHGPAAAAIVDQAALSGGRASSPGSSIQAAASPQQSIQFSGVVHLQDLGDRPFQNDAWAGTKGQSRRLEGFQINLSPSVAGRLGIQYMAHLEGTGDTPWVSGGSFVGSRGQSRRLEGFAIRLTGPDAAKYDVYYRAHLQGIGDTPVYWNGAFCGTRGQSRRVEAMIVSIVPKGVSPKIGDPNASNPPPPSILDPVTVGRRLRISGIVPPGTWPVVIVHPQGFPYYVQPAVSQVAGDGSFLGSLYIGDGNTRPGTVFEITVTAAPSREAALRFPEGQRLSSLPAYPHSVPLIVTA
jgi:hypothetical protein